MIYRIQNDLLSVEIDSVGAEWKRATDRKTGEEYLWGEKIEAWQYCAPILFPVIGRMKSDSYFWNGKWFHMQKHGFCMDLPFTVCEQQAQKITFVLKATAETLKIYPFQFELLVTYSLEGRNLHTSFRVGNNSADEMYFSLGTHPSFSCKPGDKLYFQYAENVKAYRMNSECLLDGRMDKVFDGSKELVLSDTLFKDGALIFSGLRSRFVSLKSADDRLRVCVELNTPYLGIWSIPGEHYICIEPWYGIDDFTTHNGKLKEKRGICCIDPQKLFTYTYAVTFGE
ncbi:aldose 1-epimerase family protein [Yeguia hominis]|uniref:Aldose 1-epimerase family protein n=1 Tax=Yeguia hominis TaxID=2763662 RepID=A0A926D742_9FIRM|nr:aldose 1-epimerase family protein [Yeguia hominis]MBC8533635.1 aldose 1-epimerase family protein [Yeguia hominis]